MRGKLKVLEDNVVTCLRFAASARGRGVAVFRVVEESTIAVYR